MKFGINKTIGLFFKEKSEVIAVYLYGSYAQQKSRFMSDIDIAILLENNEHDFAIQKRMQYMIELSRILKKDIHPIIMNEAGTELLSQIFSKGKCIQVNDERRLSHFRTYTFSKIAEFFHYRDMTQKGFLKKLSQEVHND